jgi:hypothetical protein
MFEDFEIRCKPTLIQYTAKAKHEIHLNDTIYVLKTFILK